MMAVKSAAVLVSPIAEEVLRGLSARPRRLPPKLFYDAAGSRLFDQITETAEYYPTRTERTILKKYSGEIVRQGGTNITLVELGAGSASKTQVLIEALLRRPAETRETILRVGQLELDLIERTAKRDERNIDLLPREFRLLEYMMRRSDQLLTRAMLLEEVWNYKFVPTTNLVDVHMGRVRHKVDQPGETPMIHNVRGAGFILRALS